MEFDPALYLTESDVEQKLVFPLLTEVLKYFPEEIRTKTYLAPTDLDKGAGKKLGYYPDYVIYLSGLPVLVIEAKDTSVPVDVGLREGILYSHEINKRFPPDLNPVLFVLAANGTALKYCRWDSENLAEEILIKDLTAGSAALQGLVSTIGRAALIVHANKLRSLLKLSTWHRALPQVGGTSRQNEGISSNSFANDLTPVLRKYFDPDETAVSEEILRFGYVTSNEMTEYESMLRSLLKERIPNQQNVTSVDVTKKHADQFDVALKKAVREKRDVPDPLILIVGGVGAGKSMFLDRYFKYLVPTELAQSLIQLKVNFNRATDALDDVEDWICGEVCHEFERIFGPSFHDNENLRRYFSTELQTLERGPLEELRPYPEKAAELRATKLMEWHSNPQRLAFAAIRYHCGTRDVPVVVTFDNVDRRDREQQLKVFQTVQWFKAQAKCMCILSLRDETFDAFRNQPPLDAFLKPFAFRIAAPRFINVVKKRLQLAIQYLGTKTSSKLTYELSNGMRIEYPATNLGRYLLALYVSVFDQSRKIGLILEAISGRDTRRGLEMFTEILRSGYFPEEMIFGITEGRKRTVPEWLVIKILMRTSFKFYSSRRGYVSNVLDFDETGASGNCFISAEILEYLAQRRKQVFAFSIEGYLQVESVIAGLTMFGYTREDLLKRMAQLMERGLIVADHQKLKGLNTGDFVKITASGYYHLRFLSSRWEYLSNVAFDTPLLGSEAARAMSRLQEDTRDHAMARIDLLSQNLNAQVSAIEIALPEFKKVSPAYQTLIRNFNKSMSFAAGEEMEGGDQVPLDI
jgi:hypothetical protein